MTADEVLRAAREVIPLEYAYYFKIRFHDRGPTTTRDGEEFTNLVLCYPSLLDDIREEPGERWPEILAEFGFAADTPLVTSGICVPNAVVEATRGQYVKDAVVASLCAMVELGHKNQWPRPVRPEERVEA